MGRNRALWGEAGHLHQSRKKSAKETGFSQGNLSIRIPFEGLLGRQVLNRGDDLKLVALVLTVQTFTGVVAPIGVCLNITNNCQPVIEPDIFKMVKLVVDLWDQTDPAVADYSEANEPRPVAQVTLGGMVI